MSRAREIAFVVLAPLAAFLLVGELALRAYLSRHLVYDVEMTRYSRLLKVESPDPRIGHVHRPDAEATLMNVRVRINSDGLRDDEVPVERGAQRRILFLGDSITLGWGVEKEQTFEHLLERRLDALAPTEILNFGTGNHNTAQQVQLFLEKGLRYRPDRVVVFYFINDAEPLPRRSRWAWLGGVRLLTFYWSRARALTARWSDAGDYREYYASLYRGEAPSWRAARDALLELKRVCRARGIGLQVVLVPELHELADYPFEREHALVIGFLREHGIAALDLAPAFRDVRDPQSLWVAPDDAHPNPRAHRRIADASFAFLRGAGQDEPMPDPSP